MNKLNRKKNINKIYVTAILIAGCFALNASAYTENSARNYADTGILLATVGTVGCAAGGITALRRDANPNAGCLIGTATTLGLTVGIAAAEAKEAPLESDLADTSDKNE